MKNREVRKYIVAAVAVLLVVVSGNCTLGQAMVIDVADEIITPRTYTIAKTSADISIDGIDAEESWSTAPWTDRFIDIEGVKEPKYHTRVKMLWDERFLYLYAELEEPHIWGDIVERDAVVFHNNDFELFIDARGDTRRYGEIEINALGTVWDLLLDKPYRVGGQAIDHWNLVQLQTAVYHQGTVNDPSDTDEYWSVEMAIPLEAFVDIRSLPESLPSPGDLWRMNMSRVQWDYELSGGKYTRKRTPTGKIAPEYNWVWSPQYVVNMHEPEKWGYVRFGITGKEEVSLPSDHMVKQALFALHRQALSDRLYWLRVMAAGEQMLLDIRVGNGISIKGEIIKTYAGYEIKVEIDDKSYLINQDGLLSVNAQR